MRTDFYFNSHGFGKIHGCAWIPEEKPRAIFQIVHGIAEYVERYDAFARYLNSLGYLVVAEDHMGHGHSSGQAQGYFSGGWNAAVEDTYQLLQDTRTQYPDLPYVLFGHSMGSFLTRTLLYTHPDARLTAAVICGTGWQPQVVLKAGMAMAKAVCEKNGEQKPSASLEKIVFGSYNQRVEHFRTSYDWLSRDSSVVDAYIQDPLCGFPVTAGLIRDMLGGMTENQKTAHLLKMNYRLPVLFVAGGDDPVGHYGKGVRRTAEAFQNAGMAHVDLRIYPLCRHEILNEINKETIYGDISGWLEPWISKEKQL